MTIDILVEISYRKNKNLPYFIYRTESTYGGSFCERSSRNPWAFHGVEPHQRGFAKPLDERKVDGRYHVHAD